jgi:DNA-binding response OmpR family regulator
MPMAATTASTKPKPTTTRPRILVVDDEPNLTELVGAVVGQSIPCRIATAGSIAQAKELIASQPFELLVADVNLPDGNGTSLLATLRAAQPDAAAIVITGDASVDRAVTALRQGALDFLPKPFSADHLLDRVRRALERQALNAKKEKRLGQLHTAVRRLNDARRTVSKKVDLLCNDLITAYGELARQMDAVRTTEAFRKLLAESRDLEQLLCHAMDWLLRQMGYSNVAVWLASEDPGTAGGAFQLGAYMKYTIPGEPALTDAMRRGLLATVAREGFIHLGAEATAKALSPAEAKHLTGQAVLGCNCTYLGESLAAVILFRDGRQPFGDEDAAALKAISPIFAVALASIVKGPGGPEDDAEDADAGGAAGENPFFDGGPTKPSEPPKPKPRKKDDADWWKRGEPPPF